MDILLLPILAGRCENSKLSPEPSGTSDVRSISSLFFCNLCDTSSRYALSRFSAGSSFVGVIYSDDVDYYERFTCVSKIEEGTRALFVVFFYILKLFR